MFQRTKKFAKSSIGRRVIVWLAPVVVGWIVRRLSSGSGGKKRLSVKNKAK